MPDPDDSSKGAWKSPQEQASLFSITLVTVVKAEVSFLLIELSGGSQSLMVSVMHHTENVYLFSSNTNCMPSFPIIDTHLHLWDPQRLRYPWLDDIPILNKPYLLEDYESATSQLSIDKMVFLQCECVPEQSELEAKWVTELSKIDNRIQGIVPWAPLELGDGARDVLDRYSENSLIKGVRRIIQFEPNMEFCLQPDFIRGVQILAEYDLSFDICVAHIHMKNVIEMVKKCPNVRFILDHIGKPDIKNQNINPWKEDLRELAHMENVYCKMSGLITEADMERWTKEDLKPFIDHTIDCFGFERTLFGGDWPVSRQAGEYYKWVEALDWALTGSSKSELEKLYRENAEDFYKLKHKISQFKARQSIQV